jgi:hypothetical protein
MSASLDAPQRKQIERRRQQTRDYRLVMRLSTLLWRDDSRTETEIARLLGICTRTVRHWLRLYRQKGLDALCSWPDHPGSRARKVRPRNPRNTLDRASSLLLLSCCGGCRTAMVRRSASLTCSGVAGLRASCADADILMQGESGWQGSAARQRAKCSERHRNQRTNDLLVVPESAFHGSWGCFRVRRTNLI